MGTTEEHCTEALKKLERAFTDRNVNFQEIGTVIRGLKRRFENLSDDFKRSDGFKASITTFLEKLDEAILETSTKSTKEIYQILEPVFNDIKAHQKPSTVSKNSSSIGGSSSADGTQAGPSKRGSIRQRKEQKIWLKKGDSVLKELKKEIGKAGETELSLDDLDKDENAWMNYGRLTSKYVKINEDMSKNQDQTMSTSLPPIFYVGSGYDVLDKAITKLISPKSSFKRKSSGFAKLISVRAINVPDFRNIIEVVRKVNDEEKLGLDEEEMQQKAKEIGAGVIELAKARDRENLNEAMIGEYGFGSFDSDLPEAHDPELAAKLAQNDKMKGKQLKQLEEEFKRKKLDQVVEENVDALPADEYRESESESEDEIESDDVEVGIIEPGNGDAENKRAENNGGESEMIPEDDAIGNEETSSGSPEVETEDVNGIDSSPETSADMKERQPEQDHARDQMRVNSAREPEIIELSDDDD